MTNANTERSLLWKALKADGWAPEQPFVKFSVENLRAVAAERGLSQQAPEPLSAPVAPQQEALAPAASLPPFELPAPSQPVLPPVAGPDPSEMPGQRTNTKPEDEPIRRDEHGRLWFQEEVRKPSYPKPRGRRVLRYNETGVEQVTVQNGEFTETFEIAGAGPGLPAEVKITLPSYQVGIYKDPRFPFKIHCYNENEGFDLFEVEQFFGGAELVPDTVKRVYVENDLCYDIRSVIRTIEAEHRQLQLTGRIGQ